MHFTKHQLPDRPTFWTGAAGVADAVLHDAVIVTYSIEVEDAGFLLCILIFVKYLNIQYKQHYLCFSLEIWQYHIYT